MSLVMEIRSEIQKLGFDFEEFGKTCVVINGVPPEITNSSEKEIFEGLIEQFKHNQTELGLNTAESLSRGLAKRTVLREGKMLLKEERDELIDELFACNQPNYAPDGNPTFVVLSLDKLAALFK